MLRLDKQFLRDAMKIGGVRYLRIFAINQPIICFQPFCEIVQQNRNLSIIFEIMICQKIMTNGIMSNILQIGARFIIVPVGC